ncbi:hypothetical protein BH11CYA1_BH11CYA1_19660 [soil metagenome]
MTQDRNSGDITKVTDFGAGYRTRNLAEDNLSEALIEEERQFREKICKDPLIGKVLDDKYHILEVLGFGGMSVVYKAMQEPVERLVAVKTVKFRVDERPDIWKRFEREVKTLSKLSHPNVVAVYDCVIGTDSQPYVVMDYLKGSSLDQVLEHGRLSLEQTYRVAGQICLGVGHAHRHEVIHRDIKPANIMLLDAIVGGGATDSGTGNLAAPNSLSNSAPNSILIAASDYDTTAERQVKVVDFGLAKLGEDSRKLTHSGELWGSPPYMSPEQISGKDCDSRADIYSLGCVIFEMLTGKDPFWGANVYELLHCHMHSDAPTLAAACPEGQFPVQLENVIARAMAKNPAERFATMIDFKDALEEACLRPDASIRNFARPSDPVRSWSYPARDKTPDSAAFEVSAETTSSPLSGHGTAGQHSSDKSAASTHLLTYTLTFLMLAACILFAANAGRNLEHTKVRRYVPGSASHSEASTTPSSSSSLLPVSATDRPGAEVDRTAGQDSPTYIPTVDSQRDASLSSRGRFTGAEDQSEGRRSMKRLERSKILVRHTGAASGLRPLDVKKTMKDSSPNSSIGGVDQSKFDMLRRLKSTASQN